MTDTATAEKTETETIATEAPAAALPAVAERRTRTPANRRPHYSARIAQAIAKVTREIGVIQKEGYNKFQDYKYTRWEDINERLSPLLQQAGLILIQSEVTRNLLEENDKGSVLAIVYDFTWIDAETGEAWPSTQKTGIARLRDQKGITDDKAASKCDTQARKVFCTKQFNIIVSDDMHEDDQHQALPKKNARDIYDKLYKEIIAHTSIVELGLWGQHNAERIQALPRDWQGILRERYGEKLDELKNEQREAGEEVVWTETGEESTADAADKPAEHVDKETGEVT